MKPGIEQRSQGPMETQPCGLGWRRAQETRTCGSMKPGIQQRSQGPMETQPCGSGWRKGQETRTCGHCSSSISTMLHFNVCLTSLILFVTLLIKMFNYFVFYWCVIWWLLWVLIPLFGWFLSSLTVCMKIYEINCLSVIFCCLHFYFHI